MILWLTGELEAQPRTFPAKGALNDEPATRMAPGGRSVLMPGNPGRNNFRDLWAALKTL